MANRTRNPWLPASMGLLLGAATFLGSADAAPAAPSNDRAAALTDTVGRRAPRGAQASRHHRSRAGRDPRALPDDAGLSREQILAASLSESIGRAARGRLRNGVELPFGEHVHVLSANDGKNYGTAELVSLLEHAASSVAQSHPGAKMTVGDLSKAGGGHLGSHRSHRSGRDVDIGFYFTDEEGQPVEGRRFVRFGADGIGVDGRYGDLVRFDAARNWALLQAMMEYEGATLQYVFVSPRLQPLLLAEAERQGASPETIARATQLMSHFAGGHDNHFHVRIHCPADDRECVNNEPARRRRGHASHRRRSHRRH